MSLLPPNQATPNAGAHRPTMPGYTTDTGVPFEVMRTVDDEIHWLYRYAMGLPTWDDLNKVIARLDKLENRMTSIEARQDAMDKKLSDMRKDVDHAAQMHMAYDITSGQYRPSISSARRGWQASQPRAIEVADLAKLTVEEVSKMNVLRIATTGRTTYLHLAPRDEQISPTFGFTSPNFIPSDYIRRDELVVIDDKHVHDKDLAAVPAAHKPTDIPDMPPYERVGTTDDLALLRIRWNRAMYTDNKYTKAKDE